MNKQEFINYLLKNGFKKLQDAEDLLVYNKSEYHVNCYKVKATLANAEYAIAAANITALISFN